MERERGERRDVARRRIANILRTHGVAVMRTLEQKISDAGPNALRVDPHILTEVRDELLAEGRVVQLTRGGYDWYHLPETNSQTIEDRYGEQEPVYRAIRQSSLSQRVGQALEIAVFRLLRSQSLDFFGHFPDLDSHIDDRWYRKIEPPSAVSGRELPGNKALDFLLASRDSRFAGIEVKNTRSWIYPDQREVRELLWKCCHLDVVPVLIARRIQYSTFSVLRSCGLLMHQTYNQRYPVSDRELAQKAKDKTLLGYHDIRLSNEADPRLQRFLHQNLPIILPEGRRQFDESKDLVYEYAVGRMSYPEFAKRISQRKMRL